MKNSKRTNPKNAVVIVCLLAGAAVGMPNAYAAETAAETEAEATTSADKSETDAAANEPEFVLVDGQVDKATFNGYRRFHGTCHACHGQDALGSTIAPALTESLKTLSYDDFTKTVLEGRQATDASGSASAMPAFAD